MRARVFIHADFALLIANFVRHVIAQHFFRLVIDGFAALLSRGVGIVILHRALHLVTGIAATQRADHGSHIFTPAAAELVTNHATRYRAQNRADKLLCGGAILVLH